MSNKEAKKRDHMGEAYAQFQDYGENARKQYKQLFTEMFSNLNETHIEPFAKILLERENIVMKDTHNIADKIRKSLRQQMIHAINIFWQSYGVSEALISLALCKEKFKSHEGHNWHMDTKTPVELTRPIRMRFKENRLRYLQAQLKYQQAKLEETLKENVSLRQRIQEVKEQRIYLMESMKDCRKKYEASEPELLRLQMKILDDNVEIFQNTELILSSDEE